MMTMMTTKTITKKKKKKKKTTTTTTKKKRRKWTKKNKSIQTTNLTRWKNLNLKRWRKRNNNLNQTLSPLTTTPSLPSSNLPPPSALSLTCPILSPPHKSTPQPPNKPNPPTSHPINPPTPANVSSSKPKKLPSPPPQSPRPNRLPNAAVSTTKQWGGQTLLKQWGNILLQALLVGQLLFSGYCGVRRRDLFYAGLAELCLFLSCFIILRLVAVLLNTRASHPSP